MLKPLCIDLFCGLGGWTEGFLAEGYRVVGFDIERHQYWMPDIQADEDGHKNTKPFEKRGWTQGCAISLGMEGPNATARRKLASYPGEFVIQDVLTLHGSQFRNAACIVASPPCQNYSYLAMPWSRSKDWFRPDGDGWEQVASPAAKELRRQWETEGPDNRLFDACFRIQREAIEAQDCDCGHPESDHDHDYLNRVDDDCTRCSCSSIVRRHIPLIVENVRGAIPWVGRSAWNYGSFHLWGDVPALMPIVLKVPPKRAMDDLKNGVRAKHSDHLPIGNGPLGRNDGTEETGRKVPGFREPDGVLSGVGLKSRTGGGWFGDASGNVNRKNDPRDVRKMPDGTWQTPDGTKIGGDCRKHGSRSQARKAASAQIAKIPFILSNHIAQVYKPRAGA